MADDINCMQTYLDLERLRYGEKLIIDMIITGDIKHKALAPLLLLSFIENAFKHGANKNIGKVKISIKFKVIDEYLYFSISNPMPTKSKYKQKINSPGGIGLDNVKKRLALGYDKDEYDLKIKSKGKLFNVNLKIKV